MSTNPELTSSPESVRRLPATPSLEFERKRAKKLLREMRRADPSAEFKLADAQFRIAREYGFLSWAKLVSYFTTLDRHERSLLRDRSESRSTLESRVPWVLKGHANRRGIVGQFLATFVPRFYGKRVDEVIASTVTLEDAQLVVARMNRFSSWDAMLEHEEPARSSGWAHYESPWVKLDTAMRATDLAAVKRIVSEHPELLRTNRPEERGYGSSILASALWQELSPSCGPEGCLPTRKESGPEARQITDWLVSQGLDLTETLNLMLLGGIHANTDAIAFWLERGADPNWLPPNGISILEHALVRYWNGEAVDLIASRVVPKKAFWIAAGLGDVRSLEKYFDKNGALTQAARRNRPDFTAVFMVPTPSLPDPADIDIIWEAFYVAGLNQRFAAIDALLERGFPIDYSPWDMRLLDFAIGNEIVPLAEHLVKRGAKVDEKTRESAAWHYQNHPSPKTERLLQLCGCPDGESVLRSYAEHYKTPAALAPHLANALHLAHDDAARLGQTEVQPHNLFIGMLRQELGLPLAILHSAEVDLVRLKRVIGHRLIPPDQSASGSELPYSAEATEAIEVARTEAESRRREQVHTHHLMYALVRNDYGPVAEILAAAGGSAEKVRDACFRVF